MDLLERRVTLTGITMETMYNRENTDLPDLSESTGPLNTSSMGKSIYAVAEISGKQTVLQPGKLVSVPRLSIEPGANYTISRVLYLKDGDEIVVGKPYIENFSIDSVVMEHKRGKKVIVFKKKRRKGYKVKRGSRQRYSIIQVGRFGLKSSTEEERDGS